MTVQTDAERVPELEPTWGRTTPAPVTSARVLSWAYKVCETRRPGADDRAVRVDQPFNAAGSQIRIVHSWYGPEMTSGDDDGTPPKATGRTRRFSETFCVASKLGDLEAVPAGP